MSTCDDVREQLSAALDGEADLDAAPRSVRHHLAECTACTHWADEAARLNRLLRISPAVEEDPGFAEAVLAQVRLPRRGRWLLPLRVALGLVALAQLVIGVTSLIGPLGMSAGMPMPGSAHVNHEEAAFNIAFGIALVMVAWNGRRAAAQVPVLGAFVLILAISSAFDLVDGNVTWPRLATHLPIVLGLLLAAAIGRITFREPGPRLEAARPRRNWVGRTGVASLGDIEPPMRRRDRSLPPPAARRDAA